MPVQWTANLKGKIHDDAVTAIEDLYQKIGILQSHVASNDENTKKQIAAVAASASSSQSAAIEQAVTSIPAAQLTGSGISTGINRQGSILPAGGTPLFYNNATANTIIWYYTGLIIPLPDGSKITVPDTSLANPSITVSGLTPSTTYSFYPYYSTDLQQVLWAQATGGVGTPPAAYTGKSLAAAQISNGDTAIPLSTQSSVTAAATGGGGGGGSGGGSGCIRGVCLVETRRSLLRIKNLKIGDEILGPVGWTEVIKKRTNQQDNFLRFDFGMGDWLEVTPTHPMVLHRLIGTVKAKDWTMHDMVGMRNGMPAPTTGIHLVNELDDAVEITCSPNPYFFVGGRHPDIIMHNFQIPK